MIDHIPSLTSLIDRCAHRAAMHFRTKTALLNNAAPIVSFTFDDVPESAFSVGAATLDAHGVKGTFYIAGALCDTVDSDGRSLITSPECLELHRRGHEIGCHTFSHRKVGSLDHQALHLEIERNKAFFSAIDSSIVLENFAYPYNLATPRSKLMLQRRFRSCRAGVPGVNVGSVDLGLLKTVEIRECALSGADLRNWIDEARATRGWLIFLTHDVGPNPGPWGCSPELLETAVSYALSRECAVLSVRDAMSRIGL